MSNKKHKGDHGKRAELRAKGGETALKPLAPGKMRRIHLRNPLYIFLTALVIVGCLAILIGFELLGLWDNPIGAVLSVLVGIFACLCCYDLFLLFSASVAFGEGLVNAGKNAEGKPMIFHASSVTSLEVRDREGNPLPDGQRVYKKVYLAFVMESGRVNQRELSRLTADQLARLRAALEGERKSCTR